METSLYEWLKENDMTIIALSKKIGCHRERLRFVQYGKPVSLRIALAIRIITNGRVNPAVKNVGRPKVCKQSHNSTNN